MLRRHSHFSAAHLLPGAGHRLSLDSDAETMYGVEDHRLRTVKRVILTVRHGCYGARRKQETGSVDVLHYCDGFPVTLNNRPNFYHLLLTFRRFPESVPLLFGALFRFVRARNA